MSDYERIASAIRFLCEHATRQPDLNSVAAHLHMSPYHFQRLFCRWAGVTPKRFLQVLTVERAKLLLEQSCSVLDVAHTLGLSSGSRLYDHFVQLEAVTPGEYRAAGSGLNIGYGVHDTPFGQAVVAITPRGICYFSFLQEEPVETHLSRLDKKWPRARVQPEHQATLAIIRKLFGKVKKPDRLISLYVSGTNFQISVWKALLQIPPARVVSYTDVARAIGHPDSARAVGQAVAANPVGLLIPCHRVIQQSGKLGGYFWGETRKQAIHAWESARV